MTKKIIDYWSIPDQEIRFTKNSIQYSDDLDVDLTQFRILIFESCNYYSNMRRLIENNSFKLKLGPGENQHIKFILKRRKRKIKFQNNFKTVNLN